MGYVSMNCEEAPESRILRKKDEEIDELKDIIVDNAKERLQAKARYQDMVDYNVDLRDVRNRLRRELDDMYGKISEIKGLLKLANYCANDTTKSQRQRDVSKIRVELLNDVLDILEGKDEEEMKK